MAAQHDNPSGAGFSLKYVQRDDGWYLLVSIPARQGESYGPFETLKTAEQGARHYLDGKDPRPIT